MGENSIPEDPLSMEIVSDSREYHQNGPVISRIYDASIGSITVLI